MESALGTAKARGADVHVIQVVPHRAVYVDDRTDPWLSERPVDRGLAIGPRFASMLRSVDHDDVRGRRVTLRGEPADVFPAYAQRLGARIIEHPVHHRPRSAGETKYGVGVLSRGLAGLADCLAVRWMGKRLRDTSATDRSAEVSRSQQGAGV